MNKKEEPHYSRTYALDIGGKSLAEKLHDAEKRAKNATRIDSILYLLDTVLARESKKYRDMKVSLSYKFLPIEDKFREVIAYSYLTGRTKTAEGYILIDDGKDLLDIMAELLAKLQNPKGKKGLNVN